MLVVEVIVASVILAISGMAMLSMMDVMRKQIRSLDQKLESISLASDLQRLILDGNSCGCMFNGVSIIGNSDVPLQGLKRGCFSDYVVRSNSSLPGSQTGLKVKEVKLTNITTTGAEAKSAELFVSFDEKSLSGPLHSVSGGKMIISLAGNSVSGCSGNLSSALVTNGSESGYTIDSIAQTCRQLGGQWNGSICLFQLAAGNNQVSTGSSISNSSNGNGGKVCRWVEDARYKGSPACPGKVKVDTPCGGGLGSSVISAEGDSCSFEKWTIGGSHSTAAVCVCN
jgi:hypothetical protein